MRPPHCMNQQQFQLVCCGCLVGCVFVVVFLGFFGGGSLLMLTHPAQWLFPEVSRKDMVTEWRRRKNCLGNYVAFFQLMLRKRFALYVKWQLQMTKGKEPYSLLRYDHLCTKSTAFEKSWLSQEIFSIVFFTFKSNEWFIGWFLLFILFQGKRGLVLVKTLSLLLVATYTDSMFPSVCVEAVEKLGKVRCCCCFW